MAASLSGEFNFNGFTSAGALAASYRLYTYTAGTTTKKTAYTDAAASVAHTYTSDGAGGEYIALNARGELPAPLFLTTGSYDITLKTDAGVTVWTRRARGGDDPLRDDLDDAATATLGAGMVGFGPALAYAAGTVGAHLKLSASPTDTPYLAAGDGTTNDSGAFAAFEAAFSGRVVDLSGKSYVVSSYPTKNTYVNGKFIIAKSATINGVADSYNWIAAAERAGHNPGMVNLFRDARSGVSSYQHVLTQVLGLQSFCMDEVNDKIYTLHLTGSGASEVSYISQYALSGYPTTSRAAAGVSNSHAGIGHQGLATEYRNDSSTPYLWSAVRYEATNYPLGHLQAMRFTYAGNAADVTNVGLYQLFDSSFAYTGHSTLPAVSPCQQYLVATGRTDSRSFYVRVFSLKLLSEGGAGDYSNKWEYSWQIDRDILEDDDSGNFRPVQGVACDGASVYVLSGNSRTEAKRIDRYTLDGRLLQSQNNISVGLTEAQADGAGTFYEPEGITFYRPNRDSTPVLTMLALSGDSGARINRLFTFGYDRTITEQQGTLAAGRWTPTATAVTNVAAITSFSSHYSRVGNIVNFGGRVNIDPTATGFCEARLSLPVASNLTSLTDAVGALNMIGVTGTTSTVDTGGIEGDTTNDELLLKWICTDTANRSFYFAGSYEVK